MAQAFKDNSLIEDFNRAQLPPELISLVDQAEQNMQTRLDQIADDFKRQAEASLTAFTDRDFGEELSADITKSREEMIKVYTDGLSEMADHIAAVKAAAENMEDDGLKQAIEGLTASQEKLTAKLDDAHHKAATFGAAITQTAITAVKKAFTGFLG